MTDIKRNSGIGPEADAALRARSAAFVKATQRKGLPTTWGTGELRKDMPQPKAKKGKRAKP